MVGRTKYGLMAYLTVIKPFQYIAPRNGAL